MNLVSRWCISVALVGLLAAGGSAVSAEARVTGKCTGATTLADAQKMKAAKGVAWAVTSDENKSLSCFYKAVKGDHGYTIGSPNAWTIKVDGVEKAKGPGLAKKGNPVMRGTVKKVPQGAIVEITVLPGCSNKRCGHVLTAAMGTR